MSTQFKNRAFGCVIVKSLNSNYNADFTSQPRTLPDGVVYATDKVLKYSVRNFMKKAYPDDKVFFFKSLDDNMQPRTLLENYKQSFGIKDLPKVDKKDEGKARKEVAKNLLSCLDVRLFGATFAPKAGSEKGDDAEGGEDKKEKKEDGAKSLNISIHGAVQITHGVNRFPKNEIYSEQIMAPFRNPNDKNTDSTMTTLGSQSKLKEGHYVHHFSINPNNIDELVQLSGGTPLSTDDVVKLKAGLSRGVTLYDSAAKAGTENELMLYVQLKEGSFLVLPSFVRLIDIKNDEKRTINLSRVSELLAQPQVKAAVEKIELYYDKTATTVENAPEGAIIQPINA